MSAETYRALEQAVTNHVLDEQNGEAQVVRDWAIVAATADISSTDELQEICLHRSAGTTLYATTGLLTWAQSMYGTVDFE
jgi:hypothetical protein